MTVERTPHLKQILLESVPGRPITTRWLAQRGVSPQLTHHYVANGWLERLGHSFFIQKGTSPTLEKSLSVAMTEGHIGGKTALAWAGIRHNLYLQERTVLYSHSKVRVARWCVEQFSLEMRNKTLFGRGDSQAVATNADGVPVSEPERAVLELLSDVPGHQGIEEAENLVEMLSGLRPRIMQSLLEDCINIKTVRLFRMLAQKSALPVLDDIDFSRVRQGADTSYVLQTPKGTLKL